MNSFIKKLRFLSIGLFIFSAPALAQFGEGVSKTHYFIEIPARQITLAKEFTPEDIKLILERDSSTEPTPASSLAKAKASAEIQIIIDDGKERLTINVYERKTVSAYYNKDSEENQEQVNERVQKELAAIIQKRLALLEEAKAGNKNVILYLGTNPQLVKESNQLITSRARSVYKIDEAQPEEMPYQTPFIRKKTLKEINPPVLQWVDEAN